MTTVADGLFQYGGMPVNSGLFTSKIFSTPSKGRAWFVDATGASSGNGKSPKTPFPTMAAAFAQVASGDIIYFVGKVTEQLTTPVQVFDVTIVGCGNRPRHADAAPTGSAYATATWAAPATPVATVPLVTVLQQGWRFVNILFAGSAGCPSINFVRNAAAGDLERDSSHGEVIGCRFAGVASTDTGIKFGAASYTEIVNNVLIKGCDFQGCAKAIGEQSAGLQYRCQVVGNTFISNTNDIVVGGYFLHVVGNIMSLAPTGSLVLSGGTGSSQVHGNYLPGTYANGALYAPGTGDNWNGNYASTGVTAAVPA
jgi:hypothetical protein